MAVYPDRLYLLAGDAGANVIQAMLWRGAAAQKQKKRAKTQRYPELCDSLWPPK
jgi:hypothetical protein